ncbi:hypothetical protein [Billgrantia sp. C5P2]|uniref:hypothetical protein n=1 Tax=Billgrantia sp. C5P2 TaxID=3436239 RepID=UPI003DA4F929
MQNHDTTVDIQEIEVHSRRAWALTSMLITYVNQETDKPSPEVMNETLMDIWENLDAIGAATHKGAQA